MNAKYYLIYDIKISCMIYDLYYDMYVLNKSNLSNITMMNEIKLMVIGRWIILTKMTRL